MIKPNSVREDELLNRIRRLKNSLKLAKQEKHKACAERRMHKRKLKNARCEVKRLKAEIELRKDPREYWVTAGGELCWRQEAIGRLKAQKNESESTNRKGWL